MGSRTSFGLAAMGCLLVAQIASAQSIPETIADNNASNLNEKLGVAKVGEKLFVESQNGAVSFAGQEITVENFSGIMGYAADVAYVVVAQGSASAGSSIAKKGSMLLLPPLGKKPTVARYDAERLMSAQHSVEAMPANLRQLFSDVAKGQSLGILTGRLGRTNFNVAASGNARNELARRSVVGGKALRDIRFSKTENQSQIEQRVVETFARALMAKDTETIAELLDPLTFGESNLNNGGAQARLVMAGILAAEQNWSSALAGYQVQKSGDVWNVTGSQQRASFQLRTTTDFVFVKSVQTGGI